MAQKKKTAKKAVKTEKTPRKSKETIRKEERRKKVFKTLGAILAYFLFTILLFLCFYSDLLSVTGEFVKNIFLGIFGKTSYAFPFALIYGFVYYFKQKKVQL